VFLGTALDKGVIDRWEVRSGKGISPSPRIEDGYGEATKGLPEKRTSPNDFLLKGLVVDAIPTACVLKFENVPALRLQLA
jgi:hypothetical protein